MLIVCIFLQVHYLCSHICRLFDSYFLYASRLLSSFSDISFLWVPLNEFHLLCFICILHLVNWFTAFVSGEFPQGCTVFRTISPNVESEESGMRDDSGMQDVAYTEVAIAILVAYRWLWYLTCNLWKYLGTQLCSQYYQRCLGKPCATRNVGQCPTWWPPCRI